MTYKLPNHTQTPNELFDVHMRDMDMAELKVVLGICRKTFGWHKTRDKISLSQLEEITGMSRTSCIKGTQDAIGRGIVERFACDDGFEYGLVVEDDSTESVPGGSTENVHTKETIQNKTTASAKRGDLLDAMMAYSKPADPTAGFPADVADYLEVFFEHYPKLVVDSKGKWIKQVQVWQNMRLTPADIDRMCRFVKKQDGWGVSQPSSITSAYNMMRTEAVEKEQPVARY
jgi:phage replication O-like protein O